MCVCVIILFFKSPINIKHQGLKINSGNMYFLINNIILKRKSVLLFYYMRKKVLLCFENVYFKKNYLT